VVTLFGECASCASVVQATYRRPFGFTEKRTTNANPIIGKKGVTPGEYEQAVATTHAQAAS